MIDEDVIKFTVEHTDAPPIDADTSRLAHWRKIFFDLNVIGVDPHRYGGAGFGNISQRLHPYPGPPGQRAFLVSGSQTGGLTHLSAEHWVEILAYDAEKNRVTSRGPMLPSSETMTHGTIYDLSADLRVVLHVHAPTLWHKAHTLPCTSADIGYGTPAMAHEARRLWNSGALSKRRLFAMLGHEDGIISFGRDADEAGETLLAALR